VGGGHHVRRVKELDNQLDGWIRTGRGRSKEHHGLGYRELLLLGHRGAQSLDASVKYGTAMTASWSLITGGGDEKDVGVGSGDEGRARRQE
jgi:hypothetical protein